MVDNNKSTNIDDLTLQWGGEFAWEAMEALGQGITIVDKNSCFEYVNPAFAEMVGRSVEQLIGKSPLDHTLVDDHVKIKQALTERWDGKKSSYECCLTRPDGSMVYTLITGVPRIVDGEVVGSYAIITDLTEQKQAEIALHKSEKRYRQLFENALTGIFRSTPEGRFQEVNPALVNLLGYDSAEEVLALNLEDDIYVDPSERTKLRHNFEDEGIVEDVILDWKRKDGQPIKVRVNGRVVRDNKGEIEYFEGVLRDVTKFEKASKALQEEKAITDAIVDSLPGIFMVYNQENEFVRWNKNLLKVTGYSGQELRVLRPIKIIDPSDRQKVLQKNEAAFVKGEESIETCLLTKDGRLIPYFFTVRRVWLNDQPVIICLGLDITERKEAEINLQRSEANLTSILNNTLQAFVLFDRSQKVMLANRTAQRFAEQILQKPLTVGQEAQELFTRFDVDNFNEAFNRTLQGELIIQQRKVSSVLGDFWFETNYNPVVISSGDVVGVSISVLNITEQKRSQEALQQSEARYRAIVEDQTELIVRCDQDGVIGFANEAFARLSGLGSADQLIGLNLFEFVQDDLKQIIRAKFDRLTPDNPVEIDEHDEVLPDGRAVWLRWTDRGIFDENGRLLEIQSVGVDITERYEAEKKLRQNEATLKHIIDSVPEGVLLLDPEGKIILTNPVADQFLQILLSGQETNRVTQLGQRSLSQLLSAPPEGLWHEIEFESYTFEAIARPLENDFERASWVFVIRDVTQERLIQQGVQQQERLAAVGQLAAGIAHDFNNILAVITLYTQLISRTVEMSPRDNERMIVIENQAQRAKELVQQILDFSRQSVIEKRPLDLSSFINKIGSLLRRTLPENIEIIISHQDQPFVIEADHSRIQQILMNLAVNARDAMPDGGSLTLTLSHLTITHGTKPPLAGLTPGDWIRMEVKDSGEGIPDALIPYIFEPFFTTKEVGQGSGLGLSQVFGTVRQHGGLIDVLSHVGQGSTFVIYFPTMQAAKIEDPSVEGPNLVPGQGQTVLIVEDNEEIRSALVESLELLNYCPLVAKNGREALSVLASHQQKIALILSDVIMPDMGGIALLDAIRQDKVDLPFVLLTGHPLNNAMKKLQELNLTGWLAKPPDLTSLSHLLANTLKN